METPPAPESTWSAADAEAEEGGVRATVEGVAAAEEKCEKSFEAGWHLWEEGIEAAEEGKGSRARGGEEDPEAVDGDFAKG